MSKIWAKHGHFQFSIPNFPEKICNWLGVGSNHGKRLSCHRWIRSTTGPTLMIYVQEAKVMTQCFCWGRYLLCFWMCYSEVLPFYYLFFWHNSSPKELSAYQHFLGNLQPSVWRPQNSFYIMSQAKNTCLAGGWFLCKWNLSPQKMYETMGALRFFLKLLRRFATFFGKVSVWVYETVRTFFVASSFAALKLLEKEDDPFLLEKGSWEVKNQQPNFSEAKVWV